MAVLNKRIGAPITATRARRGERPDLYAARLASAPIMQVVNGRPGIYAEIVSLETNLDGEQYLAQRVHNLAFAFDRSERVEALDGTAAKPKTIQELVAEQAKAALEFAMNRPEAVAEIDLDSVEA